MPKIVLTMITKNEEATIRQCLQSIAPHVDQVIVVDTGSSDKTVEIVREFTGDVHHFEWIGDFSAARQYALDLVPEDADWIIWADADDVVMNAQDLHMLAETAPADCDGIVFPYDYAHDRETGECVTELSRERLLRGPKTRWKWRGIVHEVIAPADGTQPRFVISDAVRYVHHRPADKDTTGRNLELIEKYIEDCDRDAVTPEARMVVYLGSELMAVGRWAEAINAFNRYMLISEWEEEKYQANHKLADCYRKLERYEEAIITELKGFQIRDDWADGYYGLAECYYHLKDWDRVLRWLERGDLLGPPKTLLITHPLDYSFLPKVFRSIALFNKGDTKKALEVCKEALAIVPHDMQLQSNKKVFEQVLRQDKTIESILNLSSELVVHDEPLKALRVLESAPEHVRSDRRYVEALHKTRAMLAHLHTEDAYLTVLGSQGADDSTCGGSTEAGEEVPRKGYIDLVTADIDASSSQRVLVVGASDVELVTHLASSGHDLTVVDPSPLAVDRLSQALADSGIEGCNIQVGWLDSVAAPFDVILAFDVIQTVPDEADFLRRLDLLTSKGGLIALSSRARTLDPAATEALGIAAGRRNVRLVTRASLTEMVYQLDLGFIKSSSSVDGVYDYVSFSTTRPLQRDVTIYCPFSYEEWGPHSLDSGIGGSEEAVIHMANELTAAGHRVTVFGGWEGASDWVLYHNHTEFNPATPRDVVVVWRTPHPLDMNINASNVYIWMHDVPDPAMFSSERVAKADCIWVLSQWHRECLPDVPDNKIQVIRNGVNILPVDGQRDLKKVVWGSSPDRGLDKLLAVWPDVLAAVPDAKLHCFYGFDMYDRFNRPVEFKQHILALVERYSDSITWHGRVGQQDLWEHFSTAAIWAYPTYFDEISCITAMRAQITGAWPVVVPKAALAETVRYGTKVDHDIRSDEGLIAFRDALIYELQNPVSAEVRQQMMDDASSFFTWAAVADLWRERFSADYSRYSLESYADAK